MKEGNLKFSTMVLGSVFALVGCGTGTDTDDLGGQPEPPALGSHVVRADAGAARPSGSPDLVFHGGQIITATRIEAIFWGPSWADPAFVGDKMTGIDSFYSGIGGSAYLRTNTEYTGTNGQVSAGVTYFGHVVDTGAAQRKTTSVGAEVCNMINNPASNGYYPVYTDLPRGHASFCAWHSYGICQGVPVTFGFFFDLAGDPGCDPQDTQTTHSQPLAALANVSGHELSEAITDPRNGGWYDSSGAENADKCAWTFNGLESFANNTTWKIQGNWSNAAYDNGQTGYALGGCINGN
jgi:hypothetical protein